MGKKIFVVIIFSLILSQLLANPIEELDTWSKNQTCNIEVNDVVNFFNRNREEGDITFGNEYIFNSAHTSHISATTLDATHFIVAYSDVSNSNYGTALVGTVSGSIISYGSEYVFNTANTKHISTIALDATHFIVVYIDFIGGHNSVFIAKAGSVSGSSILYGSGQFFHEGNQSSLSASTLDTTHFVVAYESDVLNPYRTDYGAARIGTVSGSDISFGSEFVFNNEAMIYNELTFYISVTTLDVNHFIVAYMDDGNFLYGTARVGVVSGSDISFGPECVFNNADSWKISTTSLDATRFAVAYQDTDSSVTGTGIVRIGSVSGYNISYGPENVFYSQFNSSISVTSLDANHFVLSYKQYVPHSAYGLGISILGYVSGNTISFGSQFEFYGLYYFYLLSTSLDANRFILAYSDNNDNRYGITVVGEVETALGVPTNVFITINGNDIELSWDNIGSSTYNVYRSLNPYAEDWGDAIGSSDVNSYVDEGAAASETEYFYYIASEN